MRNQKVERLSQGPGKTLKFVFFFCVGFLVFLSL